MRKVKYVKTFVSGLLIGTSLFAIGHMASQATTSNNNEVAKVTQINQFSETRNLADLVENVSPAVVQVIAKGKVKSNINQEFRGIPNMPGSPFEEFFKEFRRGGGSNERAPGRGYSQPSSIGSGFIVEADGIVITNNHVVDDAEEVTVRLKDGRELKANVLGTDPKTDLAVLKIDEDETFDAVDWGNSDQTRVGDSVFAVGSPFGLHGSVTSGIVSARGREIGSGPYDDFIQTDTPINKGNSGGPLFDQNGEVIGVNTAIYSPGGGNVGIGFAIPAEMAKNIVADLIEDGTVERGWIGVSIQPVTDDIADSLGLDSKRGALISDVVSGGPSEKAGLRAGDVILSFNGENIDDLRDLTKSVALSEADSTVEVSIWSEEREKTIDLKVGTMEEPKVTKASFSGRGDELPKLGLALNEKLEVVDVDPESVTARKNVRIGDKIESVNNVKVSSLDDIRDVIAKALEEEREAVLLRVKNKNGNRFIAVPLERV